VTETETRREAGAGGAPYVAADFDRAAPRYDLMVALNPGYHRHLRSAARALLERLPRRRDPKRLRLLDLGCGSGASTRALLTAATQTAHRCEPEPTIVAVDASPGMLAEAGKKVWPQSVRFHQGLAEELPDRGPEWGLTEPIDGVFAAYLFRNLPAADAGPGSARDQVLRAVRSLLRPTGVLVIQEYSVSGSRRARLIWTLVCRLIVMPLSRLTHTDVALYDYLWRSVLSFDSVERFADRLRQAGFVDVEVRTVPGWQQGILHTFRAGVP
jgi:ubiquinone/menaquinone biosynthesis C-methylase UbiE